MVEAGASGHVWTPEELAIYLENPKQAMPGNKMTFPGLKKPEERADVIAYLVSVSERRGARRLSLREPRAAAGRRPETAALGKAAGGPSPWPRASPDTAASGAPEKPSYFGRRARGWV